MVTMGLWSAANCVGGPLLTVAIKVSGLANIWSQFCGLDTVSTERSKNKKVLTQVGLWQERPPLERSQPAPPDHQRSSYFLNCTARAERIDYGPGHEVLPKYETPVEWKFLGLAGLDTLLGS